MVDQERLQRLIKFQPKKVEKVEHVKTVPSPPPPSKVVTRTVPRTPKEKIQFLEKRGFVPEATTEKIEKISQEIKQRKEIKKSPTLKTYTRSEWVSQKQRRMVESEKQLRETEQTITELKDDVTYRYIHPKTGEPTHLLGRHIKSMYLVPHAEQSKKIYLQEKKGYFKALDLPHSATIKETPTGYIVQRDIQAEQQTDWERLSGVQQVGKAAYVGLTQWPGTLWEAFTSPITGKGVKEYSKELVLWEAGTWEQAKGIHKGESPWAFIGSTLTTPAVIEAATLGIFKGAGILARPVARAGIRTGARFAGRIAMAIPDEKLYSHFAKKLVESPLGKRIWEWSAKGYKFGYRLAPGGTRPIRKVLDMGKYLRGEKITQKLISGRSLERVWLSPSARKFAQEDIAKRIGKRISIGFPKKDDMVMSVLKQDTRLVGKKLVTYQKTFYTGYTPLPKIAGKTIYKAPGFIRGETTVGISLKGLSVESGKSKWFRTVGEWRSIQTWKPGTPISPVKLVLLSPEKRWHLIALGKKRLPLSFRYAKEAVASLRPKLDVSLYRPSKTIGFKAGKLGITQRLSAPVITTGIPESEIFTMFGITKLGKHVIRPKQDRVRLPTMESRRDTILGVSPVDISAFAMIRDVKQGFRQRYGLDISPAQIKDMDLGLSQQLSMQQAQLAKSVVLPTPSKPEYYTPKPFTAVPIVLPKPKLYGRGRKQLLEELYGLKYRERTFKIPTIKQLFGIKNIGK